MKKRLIIIFLLSIAIYIFPIKFTIDTKNERKLVLQTIFGLGFSMDAVSDLFGITEYQSFFINTAFHVNDFGIGLNFKLRFKFNIEKAIFYEKDWYVKEDPLKTVFTYFDKIEYIKYGTPDLPFYFTTGKIPNTTFGTGFVLNDFHNHTFLPVVRENGFYFKYNGENFDKNNINKNPFEFAFLITDLMDPDIYAANFSLDMFKLTPLHDYSLIGGVTSVFDFNANEKNRVSSFDANLDKGNYRNIASNGFTTSLMIFSLPLKFNWAQQYYQLTAFHEISFLFDPQNIYNNGYRFGWGDNIGAEMRFLNIKNSGFLLGITNSFMIQSSNYSINYFSSNYEIVRYKQYMKSNENYLVYIMTGFSLYAMSDNLQFHFKISIPLNAGNFTAKISSKFVVDKLFFPTSEKLPDFYFGVYFESGINQYRIDTDEKEYLNKLKIEDPNAYNNFIKTIAQGANGEYFLDSLTQDFRFSVELGFKFYGTKFGILIGVQRPQSIDIYDGSAKKRIMISKFSNFNNDIEKFISLEVAFVF